jgi:glycosyltransferase involved in cell wall biosynthesis
VTADHRSWLNLRLAVIGGTPHWIGPDGTSWSYEPYVREMRVWAGLFAEVEVCMPEAEGPMVGNQAPYERPNILWRRLTYPMRNGFQGKLSRLRHFPGMIREVARAIRCADFVLLRSPDHVSLVGALCVRSLGRPSLTKWAGENGSFQGERLPSRVQRILEGIPSARNPVLVYGPAKKAHQVSFLPALMGAEELSNAQALSSEKAAPPPWRILSVGRLDPIKGFDLAIQGLGLLRRRRPELPWNFTLVGDGSERHALERLAAKNDIADRVCFAGALRFDDVQIHYARAHLAIMPGVKEGWPKVIAEAWMHGALPVAASAGLAPWILPDEEAGVCFEPTPEGLSTALARVMAFPERVSYWQSQLPPKACELSLEVFESRLRQVLLDRFGFRAEYCPVVRAAGGLTRS